MAKESRFKRAWHAFRSVYFAPINSISSYATPNQADFGVTVNADSALKFTAVYAAVKILSENVAALPKSVLKANKNGYVEAKKHPAYKLLKTEPNGYTDNFAFWFSMIADLEGKGNAFSIIERNQDGDPVALHHVSPDYVTISVVNGRKVFIVNHPDPAFRFLNGTYLDFEMLHIMLFTEDGIWGIDPIVYNAAAIGRGIATQKFSAEFYRRGGNIKGTLETDQVLGDDAYKRFMDHYNASKNFDTPLLEYGIKYKAVGITPVAAQLIQSETLSIQDIARIFSIPPHLLAELSHATFSNIEQQNIFFASYSLRPLCKRIEQQIECKLFTSDEQGTYSVKFDLKGMMRGDDAARANYYSQGINNGWMTPNEARKQEGYPALPGLDRPRVPLNYDEIDSNGNRISTDEEPATKNNDAKK